MIIAAPASGNGKTVFTLGLLRSLHRRGKTVAAFKIGPDYIDPGFHAATIGRPSFNLDCWAMRPSLLRAIANAALQTADYTVAEGVMGLFDGATANQGSTADVAAMLGWPILLIVDVGAQAASAAAVVRGFATHRTDIQIGAVIFNRVGGAGHAATLREACQGVGVAIAGMIPFDAQLALPERHLGLVLAGEHNDLDAFVDHAADLLESSIDMAAIESLARTAASRAVPAPPVASPVPPLGQRIAVAHDQAFAFAYPHLLSGWRAAGAEIIFFSPLADAPPDANADAVFLPGGYPELHAGRIAASRTFTAGLHNAARRGAIIYGECGGYMVLGDALTDAQGNSHRMAGLLPLSTSFAKPGLGFGYRRIKLLQDGPFGQAGTRYRGHEFHYATISAEDQRTPLFSVADVRGERTETVGNAQANVMGSFIHLIDRDDRDDDQESPA